MPREPVAHIGRNPTQLARRGIPIASTMLGSLACFLPYVATAHSLPPLGFLMFLAWRIQHRGIWPIWAGLPLGLFDDLFSGQPLGSAMLLWTLAMLALDLLDRRLVWRDVWQDWALASGFLTLFILLGVVIANLTGGGAPLIYSLPVAVMAILLFPLATRICVFLDRWRLVA